MACGEALAANRRDDSYGVVPPKYPDMAEPNCSGNLEMDKKDMDYLPTERHAEILRKLLDIKNQLVNDVSTVKERLARLEANQKILLTNGNLRPIKIRLNLQCALLTVGYQSGFR